MFVFISINNSPGAWWLGPLTLMLSLCAQYGWGPSWQAVRHVPLRSSSSCSSVQHGSQPASQQQACLGGVLMVWCVL